MTENIFLRCPATSAICPAAPLCGYMDSCMPTQLHRTFMLSGPAGPIEPILWSPSEPGEGVRPPLAAVVCHPHPLFGGTMHNKVVYQTAKTIHRFGLPVVRFNFRGEGLSEGTHDKGVAEKGDVQPAIAFLAAQSPGARLLLAGFRLGSWLGLRGARRDPPLPA